ncbi:TPA: hypothetical protein DCW56_04785 [Candidatus Peregrinibacteria bacterium]|nr:hypothetical protein [Candidatus Peregrinibacteria bacterium]
MLTGAILFEEIDDPEEVISCCREALNRLDGLSRGHLPAIDDPDEIRRYLGSVHIYFLRWFGA